MSNVVLQSFIFSYFPDLEESTIYTICANFFFHIVLLTLFIYFWPNMSLLEATYLKKDSFKMPLD